MRQRALARHFGTGSRRDDTLGSARKHACRGDQLRFIDTRACSCDGGGKIGDRALQFVDAVDILLDEPFVIKPFGQDDMNDPGEHRGIFARPHRQMNMCERRDVALARVGDDQLESLFQRIAKAARGGEWWQAARGAIMRDDRIIADEEGDISVGECVHPAHPAAVPHRRIDLGGLVERHRRVDVARAKSLRKGHCAADPGAVLKRICTAIDGDGVRAMFGDDRRQSCADLVERAFHRNVLKLPADALLRYRQALRAVMRFGQLAALDAGITAEHRVVGVALNLCHAAVVDGDEHCAIGMAETAKTAADFGHRLSP